MTIFQKKKVKKVYFFKLKSGYFSKKKEDKSNFFTGAGYHETKGLPSKEIRFGTIICPRSNSQFGEKIQNLSIEGIIW